MNGVIDFLKTTIVGGVLGLVPLAVVAVVLVKVHGFISKLLTPLVKELELHDAGVALPRVIAVVVLILACFFVGLLARTTAVQRLIAWLEGTILSNLPGYSVVSTLSEQATGHARAGKEMRPVLARIEDAWQLALLVERIDDDNAAVFVPGAPDPRSGSVYVLTNDRWKVVDIAPREAMQCIKGLGVGSRALLAGRL
jgi:uncharacterized membrane protein